MRIKFRDNTEITISDDRGKELEKHLLAGTAPEYIAINETIVRKDFIVKLQKGGTSYERNYEMAGLPDGMTNDRREPAGGGYARYRKMKAEKLGK